MAVQTFIRVSVVDQTMKIVEAPILASGGVNEAAVIFDFCEKWDGFNKTAVFYVDEETPYHSILDDKDTCIIPWEVYAEQGYFFFGVFGNKEETRRTSKTLRYKVVKGLPSVDMMPSDPSPTVYDQIMGMLNPTSGGGLNDTARNLLIEILESAVYNTNVSGKIASLKEALASGGGSGGGDTPDIPDNPDEPDEPVVTDDITVSDGIMTIVTVGSAITVADGAMTIA